MGTQNKVYETGIHHQFPTMEKILRFPKTIQVLTMRDQPDSREKITETISTTDEQFTRIVKAAYIQTSDGFYVKMDTSILYRIEDPVKLVNMVGAGKLYEDNGILPWPRTPSKSVWALSSPRTSSMPRSGSPSSMRRATS